MDIATSLRFSRIVYIAFLMLAFIFALFIGSTIYSGGADAQPWSFALAVILSIIFLLGGSVFQHAMLLPWMDMDAARNLLQALKIVGGWFTPVTLLLLVSAHQVLPYFQLWLLIPLAMGLPYWRLLSGRTRAERAPDFFTPLTTAG